TAVLAGRGAGAGGDVAGLETVGQGAQGHRLVEVVGALRRRRVAGGGAPHRSRGRGSSRRPGRARRAGARARGGGAADRAGAAGVAGVAGAARGQPGGDQAEDERERGEADGETGHDRGMVAAQRLQARTPIPRTRTSVIRAATGPTPSRLTRAASTVESRIPKKARPTRSRSRSGANSPRATPRSSTDRT